MVREKCVCENYQEFSSEVAIHFPGIDGLQKPLVLTYPKLLICLTCGDAHFSVPERELRVLATGVPVEGSIVLAGGDEVP